MSKKKSKLVPLGQLDFGSTVVVVDLFARSHDFLTFSRPTAFLEQIKCRSVALLRERACEYSTSATHGQKQELNSSVTSCDKASQGVGHY
jgi:hypothetical protein